MKKLLLILGLAMIIGCKNGGERKSEPFTNLPADLNAGSESMGKDSKARVDSMLTKEDSNLKK